LSDDECGSLIAVYADDGRFRKHVDMARLRFGVGDYRYFREPLPPLVRELRVHGYRHLAPIANRWLEAYGDRRRFPGTLREFRVACAARGQTEPTPLLLRYREGGYNRLHQDLYGERHFPLQMTILLSRPGRDFEGGEFVLTEQQPRAQSRVEVVPLAQGEAVIFAVNFRPARGTRGFYRLAMRHGVSRVRAGERYTLGIIFHDAA
jgi:uncharacterized protein